MREPEEGAAGPRTHRMNPRRRQVGRAILASIFASGWRRRPLKAGADDPHPKKLIYIDVRTATSTGDARFQDGLDEAIPHQPFHALRLTAAHVPKQLARAINNRSRVATRSGSSALSLGVKVQLGIAKRLKKPLRFYDIADLPEQVYRISEKLAQEEGPRQGPRSGWKSGDNKERQTGDQVRQSRGLRRACASGPLDHRPLGPGGARC